MFVNNRYFLTHCFFLRKKSVQEKIYRSGRVFEREKSSIFLSKTHALQRNPSLHVLRAKRETVHKYLAIIYERLNLGNNEVYLAYKQANLRLFRFYEFGISIGN